MKPIATILESMLTKDATRRWIGQTSAVPYRGVWGWGGVFTPATWTAF